MWSSFIQIFLFSLTASETESNQNFNPNNLEKDCQSLNSFNESFNLEPNSMVFLLFGPSQVGKSSLINTLLDSNGQKYERASTGSNIGKSESFEIKIHKIGPIQDLFPNLKTGFLYIIDTPGLFDSSIKLTDEEILDHIKSKLLNSNLKALDAVLIFESMKTDSRKIVKTMAMAGSLFGPSMIFSSVLLSTKWDTVDEDDRAGTEAYLDALIIKFGLLSFKWQNNIKNRVFLTDQQMKQQLMDFGKIISLVKPYQLEDIHHYQEKRTKLALELRDQDPDRFSYFYRNETVVVPEEYLDEEFHYVSETVPLSQEEISQKAEEMWKNQPEIPGGLIPDPSGKRITERRTISEPVIENKVKRVCKRVLGVCVGHKNVPYQEVNYVNKEIIEDKGPLLIQAPSIKHPIDYFINLIKNEVKTVKVKKSIVIKKTRMIEKEELKKIKNEKYSLEHYQSLADKQIHDEYRNLLKIVS